MLAIILGNFTHWLCLFVCQLSVARSIPYTVDTSHFLIPKQITILNFDTDNWQDIQSKNFVVANFTSSSQTAKKSRFATSVFLPHLLCGIFQQQLQYQTKTNHEPSPISFSSTFPSPPFPTLPPAFPSPFPLPSTFPSLSHPLFPSYPRSSFPSFIPLGGTMVQWLARSTSSRGVESAGCGLSCSNCGPVALCTLGLGLLNPPSYWGR